MIFPHIRCEASCVTSSQHTQHTWNLNTDLRGEELSTCDCSTVQVSASKNLAATIPKAPGVCERSSTEKPDSDSEDLCCKFTHRTFTASSGREDYIIIWINNPTDYYTLISNSMKCVCSTSKFNSTCFIPLTPQQQTNNY